MRIFKSFAKKAWKNKNRFFRINRIDDEEKNCIYKGSNNYDAEKPVTDRFWRTHLFAKKTNFQGSSFVEHSF